MPCGNGAANSTRASNRRGRAAAAKTSTSPLSFLFDDYKCSQWAFDVFDMERRIAMVGLIPFAPLEWRPIVGCALSAVSLAVFQELQPYHDPATNTLAVAAQVRGRKGKGI